MSNENSIPNGAKRVLVVDDDASIRLLISHHLKKKGYDAVVAAGVLEAQALFSESADARFDAVVTDYLMPDGTGLDLLGWIFGPAELVGSEDDAWSGGVEANSCLRLRHGLAFAHA